ncbi:MAG: hypothetical protein NC817_02050 [Candidatus Omnitrophica bacterium]|nr:hypothetical protein [Candidatus Omnitrophota bacterium]MCM8824049.1 hypothetical protein [Candidatus Omnitrophota bacterium]MCM8826859.1 hypothetical protein [Candidatus Omnitrophota bacterium]
MRKLTLTILILLFLPLQIKAQQTKTFRVCVTIPQIIGLNDEDNTTLKEEPSDKEKTEEKEDVALAKKNMKNYTLTEEIIRDGKPIIVHTIVAK